MPRKRDKHCSGENGFQLQQTISKKLLHQVSGSNEYGFKKIVGGTTWICQCLDRVVYLCL